MSRRLTRGLVTAAATCYTANVLFGSAVATGVIDNRRIRWVHHALYIATCTATGSALVAGAVQRQPAAALLAPAVLPLAALPRGGGGRRHIALAASAAGPFIIALVRVWRRN